jgi:hypothetical protein
MANPVLKYNSTVFPGTSIAGIAFLTPYVSREREIDYSSEWQVDIDRYVINGSLYLDPDVNGNVPNGTAASTKIIEGRNQIIQFFSQNYKKLETELGNIDTARVRNISFEDSNYSSILEYSVTLDGPAPVKLGSSTYSTQTVKSVVDEFSFTESQSGFGTLSHRVAAQGIDDRQKGGSGSNKSDALKNAKTWVEARKGLTNMPIWEFISSTINTTPDFFKTKETENINRMSGTYEITEEYSFDPDLVGTNPAALLKYSFDITDSVDADAQSVAVQVEAIASPTFLVGNSSATLVTDIQNQIKDGAGSMDDAVFQLAKDMQMVAPMKTSTGTQTIRVLNDYSKPLRSSNLEVEAGILSYSWQWDNDYRFVSIAGTNDCVLDYTVDLAMDHVTGITTISISGTLLPDPTLDINDKITNLENWINTTYAGSALHTYLKGLVQSDYSSLSIGGTINPSPETLSINLNKTQGEATINATFTDKHFTNGVHLSNYSINVQPAMVPYTPKPSIMKDAHYIVFNPNGKRRAEWRANVTMEGTKDAPVSASVFKTLEERIRVAMNGSGTDVVKIEDTATKVYNVANARNSSIGFSFKAVGGTGNLSIGGWSISQQIEPALTASLSAGAGISW